MRIRPRGRRRLGSAWRRAGPERRSDGRRLRAAKAEQPRRVGGERADGLLRDARPVGAAAAVDMGLIDRTVVCAAGDFAAHVVALAADRAADPATHQRITDKKIGRQRDEARKPLSAYRTEELTRVARTFFDPGAPYHALRSAFVRKQPQPAQR